MAYTTINKSTDYFNTKLYTGNGSTQAITGVGFQPDWVWLKDRTDGDNHQWYDVVRGVTKSLQCNTTNGEITFSDGLTAFGTDGFTLGSNDQHNGSSDNFAAWCWRGANAQGSSNTDGTINTTYTSVNTTAGFSICQYTGYESGTQTVGHGLGVAPKLILIKQTSSNSLNFVMYHHALGPTRYFLLNSTNAAGTSSNYFGDTAPTSSVFSIGGNHNVNQNSQTFIAYCFAEKAGFSKFGKYTGNGNADGPFVYTGFKPAFIVVRVDANSDSTKMWDSKRPGYNLVNNWLETDDSQAEGTGSNQIDILSNGFKIRNTNTAGNTNNGAIYYMAFAAAPLVGSNNIVATAG